MKHDYAAECRFFKAEDACRMALAAYYAASADLEPPEGEPWVLEGSPYATASDFALCFCQQIAERVSAIAYAQRLRQPDSVLDGLWWPEDGFNLEELSEYRQASLRRIMKHLPPGDNRVNNRSGKEFAND